MNAKVEDQSSYDGLKFFLVFLIIAAAIAGFYYYSEHLLLYRVIGLLVAFSLAIFLSLKTQKGISAWLFAQEARVEVRKVIWPSRQETMQTTLIVFVVVVIVAILLWFLDMFLLWGVRSITGAGD